jgi:predicted AAA+ superfamily ATPase
MSGLDRQALKAAVERSIKRFPVTLLLGPRQCGKTTLAREIAAQRSATYFDLEDPETPLRSEVAKQALAPLRGLVVVDEFQRQPALFELIRVLVDRKPMPARFLILGSASPSLVRGASETLAGRVAQHDMAGFDLDEVPASRRAALWLRGGFPRAFLARSDAASMEWRSQFIQTFLERDVPQLGIRIAAPTLRRAWTMLAHYHGQLWNAAELARSLGVGESAARHYLDVLTGAFMVRQLPPWFENVGKRLVKAPKVYLRDSGLLHALLGLQSRFDVLSHPKLGASWEGFALDQTIRLARAEHDAFFYRTHAGAELDLFFTRRGRRYGFEFKHGDSPALSKSMVVALQDLRLDKLWVVYPGERKLSLHERVEALPLAMLGDSLRRAGLG